MRPASRTGFEPLDLLDADIEQADASAGRGRTARAPSRCPSPPYRPDARRRRRSRRRDRARRICPCSVGQSAAIAGRSMPGMVLQLNLAIAISAPVLPADTATSASPFLTASMASHIDDFQRPLRSAWLGLSSIRTATSVWTSRRGRLEPRMRGEQRLDLGLDRRTARTRCRDAAPAPARRPERPPRAHGRPPWRRARCGPSGAWIDLYAGDGTPGIPL